MTDSYTTSLDEPAAREAPHAGEKAAALARLRQGGLPVPAGFVVHASAYDAVTGPARQRIASLLAAEHEDAAALERAAGAARTFVEQLPIPEALTQAVAEAYRALGPDVPVAVRSSGTAEDLAGASFAGQYDSFLNVIGLDDVLERMRQVWGSLYSSHAIAYREQQGLPHEGSKMAVLVQTLLPAEAAGVMFTRDPLTGDESRMIVNAAFGLGEGVVAGEASSDIFTLDSATFDVIERNISAKTTMVRHLPGGGTELTAVAAERRDAPSLDDDQLRALGRLAATVRELEGGHRDIEFAVSGGEVHLLQARPVTGLDSTDGANGAAAEPFEFAWEDPADRQYAWMLSGGFTATAPVPRIEEDVRRATSPNLERLFEETGIPMGRNHPAIFVNGYMYTRSVEADRAEVGARLARQQAIGAKLTAEGGNYYFDVVEPEVMGMLDRLGPFRRPVGEPLDSRLRFLDRAFEAGARVMGDLHWRGAFTTGSNANDDFIAIFVELTGEPEVNAGTLLQALANETTRLVLRLRGLAKAVQGDAVLREIFEARDFDRLDTTAVKARPAARRFRARFQRLLRDFGRRSGRSYGSSTSFSTPTWNLDPRMPLETIALYAQQDLDELTRLEAAARRERLTKTRSVRGPLNAADRARFDEALRQAHLQVLRMENHNAVMEQGVLGIQRESIWWIGAGLVREGALEQPDDALQLSLDELRAHVASGGGDLRPLVAERKAQFARRAKLSPPRNIGDGDRSTIQLPPAARDAEGLAGGLQGTVLSGIAASRGSYTGRARVVLTGAPISQIASGDILVARNAGQDITPVLPLLGAIVLDEGAIFQHAALVAREYRIPAVIQTREGTRVISDGQRITVDGDAGTIDLAAL